MRQVRLVADSDSQRTADEPIRGDRVRRRYEHGFAQVPRALLTHEPLPSSNAVHCFALLDMHADFQTGACYPAQSTLMREMGVSNKTVRRALDELERLGFIARYPRVDPRYGRIGTDYDLLATPTTAEAPPWSPVTRGGGAGDQGGWSWVTTNQEVKGNEIKSAANARPRAGAREATAADIEPTALPDTDAEQAGEAEVLEALLALVPQADLRAVPGWVRQYGAGHVRLRAEWLAAILADPRHAPIDSPMAYLRTLLDTPDGQAPAAYRRLLKQGEREARRLAQREAEAAHAEQAAAAADEERRRVDAAQAAFFVLPPDRQAEVDLQARAAVASGPAGQMVDVPPVPEAWDARTVGAVLWRQAVGELLRTERGATL